MDLYKVVLICKNGTKTFSIEREMLFQLIESIHKKGKEIIRTEKEEYEVTGILIGEFSGQILFA